MKKTLFGALFLLVAVLLEGQTPRLVVPIGHFDNINAIAFSPDGKMVLTGSSDSTAKLWDLSGRELMTFLVHAGSVHSVAFSPDGRKVLTGNNDNTTKLWDLSGRELMTFFPGHDSRTAAPNHINTVAFSPASSDDPVGGKFILTGSEDSTAILWDLSGHPVQTFTLDGDYVNSVAFSPDGKLVMLCGNYQIKLWDLSGRVLMAFSREERTWFGLPAAFFPDGKQILTVNDDGKLILLDLSGRVLKTFPKKIPIVTDIAFSPANPNDPEGGKLILTGTHEGTKTLWNLSGKKLMTFSDKPFYGHNPLAFSPDGKQILTAEGKTLKLRDLNGKVLAVFSGHSDQVNAVAFSPAGDDDASGGKSVLTASGDGTAKLWNLSDRALKTFSGHAAEVNAVAFSPNGKNILTGSSDNTAKLWDLSGSVLKTFSNGKIFDPNSTLFNLDAVTAVAFSPACPEDPVGGKQVLTGDFSADAVLWDSSGKVLRVFPGRFAEGVTVGSVAFSPDGKKILTGGSEVEGAKLWNLSGTEMKKVGASLHSYTNSVAFSPACPDDPVGGKQILTGGAFDQTAALWDLNGTNLMTFSGHTNDITAAIFSPDGKKVLTGSADGTAKLWDLSGSKPMTFQGHAFSVTAVAFSPDGKRVLTGSDDNTTKVWDTSSGQTLVTLIAIDSTDWVVTTPSGLFDASPGAMRLMYFVVGLEVIELEQLKERYYEPGLLSKVLGFSDEPLREVEGFDSVALYPAVGLQLDTAQNKLHIRLTPRNGGVGKVSVFVNGKEVLEEANPPKGFNRVRDTVMVINLEQYARYFLADSLNDVSVRAYNAAGWLKSAPYSVTYRPVFAGAKGNDQYRGAAPARLDGAPNLFILSVGTANYAGTKLDLKFAGKDALDMANAFQQIGRQLFIHTPGKVISHILTTDNSAYPTPTKANIKLAFEAIKKESKAADILLVYFSGHGIARGDEFYYLTQDMSSFEVEIEGKGRTISNTELTRWINDIPALKQVLILDACNSGKVVESFALSRGLNSSQIRALEQLKDRTGMFVLTGSAADKVSYEAGQFGQGLLTYSLLEGIKGEVPDKFGHVDIMKLFRYATDRVPELAKGIGGIQTPVPVGPLGRSFPIGISDSSVHISIASEKPVFIRNNFQDEEHFDDGLGLTNALKDYLIDQTALGEASFIYVDVSEYESAYSMKGLYRMSGNDVEVRGRLFKGKAPVGEAFNLKGKKDDVPGLVEAIVDEVMRME